MVLRVTADWSRAQEPRWRGHGGVRRFVAPDPALRLFMEATMSTDADLFFTPGKTYDGPPLLTEKLPAKLKYQPPTKYL